ncbi:sorting nexin-29 isoform X2 [Cylas formicarius]|uniref:sorting nexin-29 isoform X2 n=1 Tax=Cylas formicarius TaxID=197179 RepID=UPI0029583785|nr:sorting nexin-29 isoform X2 [Cylas formicarius]
MSSVISSTPNLKDKPEVLDKLVKQLLGCVQECQKKYGEAIFLHGLKMKSWSNQHENLSLNETLKQVTDIVAQSLRIGQEQPTLWAFLKQHLTNHEVERYNSLKHIWTDMGRCRAWLRSTLNEKSLERYLHKLLNDKNTLCEYYDSCAILRDEEKSGLLPNMAAGLGSILFAIYIDKPELNSFLMSRPVLAVEQKEPIVEAPVLDGQTKRREQKHKVARQFISFDDDCVTVPASVSFASSDANSESLSADNLHVDEPTDEASTDDNKNCGNENRQQNATSKLEKIPRKLSFETSGYRENFSTATPDILTPFSQFEVGELRPISTECNISNFQDSGDDIVEIPTDISAVLDVVENRHQEELLKNKEKIDVLIKENNALKEQIKTYAISLEMLRKDKEEAKEQQECLHGDSTRNYKIEAETYEKKLVQVAQMHAELMDFNVILQQQIQRKDILLNRLKANLEELRGPVSADIFLPDDCQGNVNVWIPSAFLTGASSNSYYVYQIFIRAGVDEWNIYRRYAQFHALHTDLKKLDPAIGTFDFPPKKTIRRKDSVIVEDRRKRLQIYLRRVIAHWPELRHCNSRLLLGQHLAFFK